MTMDTLTVYPDGTDKLGVSFSVANGFVSRCVSAIADVNIPDAQMAADILNRAVAAEPTEDEVERAAVAIYESMRAEHEIDWAAEEERLRDCYRDTARAALIAARSRI